MLDGEHLLHYLLELAQLVEINFDHRFVLQLEKSVDRGRCALILAHV